MEKKLAAWLLQRKLARDTDEALGYAAALLQGQFPEEMFAANERNVNVMKDIGKITREKFEPYIMEKVATAQKMIAFWEENPKDTNAIFFNKTYQQNFGEA